MTRLIDKCVILTGNGTVQRRTSTMQQRVGVTDSGISGTQSTDTIVTTDTALDSTNNQQGIVIFLYIF